MTNAKAQMSNRPALTERELWREGRAQSPNDKKVTNRWRRR